MIILIMWSAHGVAASAIAGMSHFAVAAIISIRFSDFAYLLQIPSFAFLRMLEIPRFMGSQDSDDSCEEGIVRYALSENDDSVRVQRIAACNYYFASFLFSLGDNPCNIDIESVIDELAESQQNLSRKMSLLLFESKGPQSKNYYAAFLLFVCNALLFQALLFWSVFENEY